MFKATRFNVTSLAAYFSNSSSSEMLIYIITLIVVSIPQISIINPCPFFSQLTIILYNPSYLLLHIGYLLNKVHCAITPIKEREWKENETI